jgi:hypothetical protein
MRTHRPRRHPDRRSLHTMAPPEGPPGAKVYVREVRVILHDPPTVMWTFSDEMQMPTGSPLGFRIGGRGGVDWNFEFPFWLYINYDSDVQAGEVWQAEEGAGEFFGFNGQTLAGGAGIVVE